MIAVAAMLAATVASTPTLGVAEGTCRPHESGPAILITVVGLKDRVGKLRAEVYPAREGDFLADDNVLVAAGKVFRRALLVPPPAGPVAMCIRVPSAGVYALSVVHARDGGHGFSLIHDGIGFAGNPRLGHSAPAPDDASLIVGPRPTATTVVMNYRRGLFSFAPLDR